MFGIDYDRTLPATRRRREQSRQDGYVVQSRVLTSGVLLIVFGTTWSIFGLEAIQSVAILWTHSLSEWDVTSESAASHQFGFDRMQAVLVPVAVWGITLVVGVLLAVVCQTRGWFAPTFVLPRWSRVSPTSNVPRIFKAMGSRMFVATLSLGAGLAIVWSVWLQFRDGPSRVATVSSWATAQAWAAAIESITLQVGAGCIVYGLLDVAIRHHQRESRLRMTPAEWAEEQRSAKRAAS